MTLKQEKYISKNCGGMKMDKKTLCVIVLSTVFISLITFSDWQPDDGYKMHYPQLPDEHGWDVNATCPLVLADDWMCTETGPVNDIHFWGSWKNGVVGNITAFFVSIYKDIPANPPYMNYSRPGVMLWNHTFYTWQQIEIDTSDMEGWYDPAKNLSIPNDHNDYFQYNLVNISDPFIQQNGTVYWLSISAFLVDPFNTSWGWKSSVDHWNDDACWAFIDELYWIDLWEPELEPIMNEFWIELDASGGFVGGGGTDFYGDGWYYYNNTEWWNIWFYDHPFDPERYKDIMVFFEWYPTDPYFWIEIAIDWATDYWPPGGPPPIPPLPPDVENLSIARVDIPLSEPGPQFFEYTIPYYNPEWVSIDVRGQNVIIVNGNIIHECLPEDPPISLDLAFVITGEEPCFPAIDIEKSVWNDTLGDWADHADIDVGDTAQFLIMIHNNGTCCNLTNITLVDFMDDSLAFLGASPPPDIITPQPGGTELTWFFPGPLSPCHWISISLDALVLGPVCHTDFNWANITAYCPTAGISVSDSDCASVHATQPPTVDYILITWSTGDIILDANISTNVSFEGYASAYNNTVGNMGFIPVNWSVVNTGSNASTTPLTGLSSSFVSGWFNGIAIWTIDDGNGHSDTVEFTVNSSLYSMMFYKGWNLVTVPFDNSWTAETAGENISGCSTVCRFNASSQTYVTHVMGIPYNDFPIVDGTGYFVYCTVDSIFSMPDLSITSVNVSIFEKWNIVGWYHEYATTAGSLGENISNSTVVCKFNAKTQSFTTHVVGIPYNNFTIERGMGLFIYTTEASYWTGEG